MIICWQNLRALAIGLILVALVGCGEKPADEKPVAQNGGTEKANRQSAADTVVAAVDDDVLRVKDIDAEIGLQLSLARMRKRNITAQEMDSIAAKFRKVVARAFVEERLLRGYARQAGLTLSDDDVRRYEQKVARTFGKPTFERLKEGLPTAQQVLLTNGVVRTLMIQAAKRDILKKAAVQVSDEEVSKAIGRYEHLNEVAAKTNALVWAQASNVWHRITAGELTLAEAASDYSQLESESVSGGVWGEFDRERLAESEPELVERIGRMQQGEVSEPIESDNGVCIVRLDKVDPLRLSRVFFKLGMVWEIPKREEMQKVIKEANEDLAIGRKIAELGRMHSIKGLDVSTLQPPGGK